MKRLLVVALTVIALACSVTSSDGRNPLARLATAKYLDGETRALISAVLSDIMNRGYRFSADERREALRAISRFRAREFMPAVREIAVMDLVGPEEIRYFDLVAVAGALDLLADERDEAAKRLNLRRLGDQSLRGFAIQNLRELEAWDAASAVESELLVMTMSNANGNEVVTMLDFLLKSPHTSDRVCAAVDRTRLAYPSCEQTNSSTRPSFCGDLVGVTVELQTAKCHTAVHRPDDVGHIGQVG